MEELLFGYLLTGSNFNDNVAKVTGGRNGYGAKLTNIFSTEFTVETCDSKRGLLFKQTWTDNMKNAGKPEVIKLAGDELTEHTQDDTQATESTEATNATQREKSGDYTRVSFVPDLSKFSLNNLSDDDILSILEKRVYDIAGCNEGLTVYLNDTPLPSGFSSYVSLYNEHSRAVPLLFVRPNQRWEIGLGISDSGQMHQVSFVNSIYTAKGGSHVQYIAEQVCVSLFGCLFSFCLFLWVCLTEY